MQEDDRPVVSGVNIIHVPQTLKPKEIKTFMDDWIESNTDITTDPGQIVIFSPYDMSYTLDEEDNYFYLKLVGYMAREKWATLSDADDLRNFAFQLEKNHKNLKVEIDLALSVKKFEEDDENYNFVSAYFASNQDVKEMISKMHMEKESTPNEEDIDEALFGDR